MKIVASLLCVFLWCVAGIAQVVDTNALDAEGRKHGPWVVYTTDFLLPVTAEADTGLKKYIYHVHGFAPQNAGLKLKRATMAVNSDRIYKSRLVVDTVRVWHGTYTWYKWHSPRYVAGRMMSSELVEEGVVLEVTNYYPHTREYTKAEVFTLVTDDSGLPYTWKRTTYRKNGALKHVMHYKDGPEGWGFYPE